MSLVSVLIPTFNREETIVRAVSSVLEQTHQNLECIVIDDASTDGTIDLLATIKDERLQIVSLPKNKGVSFARNYGRKRASGNLLALLDSDDEWLPHRLESQLALIDKHPLVHGEEVWIRNGKRVNQKNVHQKSGGRIFQRCLHLCLISPSATLMTADLYDEMAGFREDFPVCEDYELWLRVTAKYEVGFVKEPIIKKYGGHEDQLSRKYKAMDYWRIKAMDDLRRKETLSSGDLNELKQVMKKKCDILRNGYIKHNNTENLPYIEELLSEL